MLWIFIIALIILVLCWLIFSRIELQIDSRTPVAYIRWSGIGQVSIEYADKIWWLRLRILFISMKWPFSAIISSNKRKKKTIAATPKRTRKKRMSIGKFLTLINSFKVEHWEFAIDTNDPIYNAWLYSLNCTGYMRRHIFINFLDMNYCTITMSNTLWRLFYAWSK